LLRETVEQWTGIPVSVGIAPTKTLSKVANRLAKKDKKGTGCILVIQSEEEIAQALKATAIEDVWGVGRRYADKLRSFGIQTAWDLRNLPEGWARQHMGGVVGVRLIKELNGEPCIHMKPALETKKMIATTRMFGRDVTELKELREAVATYTARAAEKLRRQLGAASFLQVFVVVNEYTPARQYNPRTYGLHCILPEATSITPELIRYALPLVDQLYRPGYKYKKAGVLLAGIVPDATVQASLFQEHVKPEDRKLMAQIDNINFSMRDGMVQYASQGLARNWKMRQEKRSPRYSSRWEEMRVIG
jgi:DNA polymerase V